MQILNLKDQPQHIATLADWHHQQWAALNPGRSIAQRIEYMQAYLSDELVPSTFIAQNSQLLGSAAITESDMDSRPELTPWLASVFVAPAFRGQGIGGTLVRHVMQQAKQAGIARLYLFTPDRVAFYEKLGWHVLDRDQYHGHQVTVMQVNLLE